MEKEYIFVYGLFRDQANPLLGEESIFCGKTTVNGLIYKVNEFYPGFVRGNGRVWGDIYRINHDVLAKLDEYEGEEYTRVKIITSCGKECWIYEFNQDVSNYIIIQEGDWLLR